MPRKLKAALAACCLLPALVLGACGGGGDEESRATSAAQPAPRPAKSSPAAEKHAKGTGDDKKKPAPANRPEQKQDDRRKKAGAPANSKQGSTSGKSKETVDPEHDGLSDEEACSRNPSGCHSKASPVDPSNPDAKRAEARDEDQDPSPRCDSADCEEIRESEG